VKGNATARGYHDHIIKKLTETTTNADDVVDVVEEFMNLKAEADATGCSTYFGKITALKATAEDIGEGELSDAMIIPIALNRIGNSGFDGTHLQPLRDKWKALGSKLFEDFVLFWEKELAILYKTSGMGKKKQENTMLLEELYGLRSEVRTLRDETNQQASDLQQVNNNQIEIAGSAEQGLSKDQFSELLAALQASHEQGGSGNNGGGNGGRGGNGNGGRGGGRRRDGGNRNQQNTGPRQFNKYCHSRGVNMQCDGKDCTKFRKCQDIRRHRKLHGIDNHDENATYANRNNGSEVGVDRWLYWQKPGEMGYYRDEACTDKVSK
jgi:hypothetical protein